MAGEGHEAHVQEQQLADPVQHAGEEAEECYSADGEAGDGHQGLGSGAKEHVRGGAVAERPEALYYDKYPIHDLAWAQEHCGRLEEVAVGDLEQQGEDHHAVHEEVTVQDSAELDEDSHSQIRIKLFPRNNIDLTGVQAAHVRGDGKGAGEDVEGLQQDQHGQGEQVGAEGVRGMGSQPRQGPGCSRQEGEVGVHGVQRGQYQHGGAEVVPRNSLNILMGNARKVNWSQLVTRRSMKDEVKPWRPGSNPE